VGERIVRPVTRTENVEVTKQVKAKPLPLPKKRSNLADILKKPDEQFIAIEENWVPAKPGEDVNNWSELIEAKKEFEILVIGEDKSDYDQVFNAVQAVKNLSKQPAIFDQINFLSVNTKERQSLDNTRLNDTLGNTEKPLAVFLFLPKNQGSHDEVAFVFTCVQSLMKVAATRQVQFYCLYEEADLSTNLYREGLSGFFKTAMLECIDHRYKSVSYDDKWKASLGDSKQAYL